MKNNGKRVFGYNVDTRRIGTRRINRYIQEYTDALGGEGRLNVGEIHTIRRVAALTVLAERQEEMMVTDDPRYNPDEHMRNVGKIKLLMDDLDLPKKRKRGPVGFESSPVDDDDPNAQSLEEYLQEAAKKPGFGKGIPTSAITGPKRKRTRL